MRLLLDTHAFLWFVLGDTRLSSTALALVVDPANNMLISPASYWEIAIKIGKGKYSLGQPYLAFMERGIFGNGFQILPIEPKHTSVVTTLPFHHRDPFDRLIVAQATVEGIPLISIDSTLDAYPITRLW
jgi:PIN domain nuclease of toxin-antitoxin system